MSESEKDKYLGMHSQEEITSLYKIYEMDFQLFVSRSKERLITTLTVAQKVEFVK